MNAKGIYKLECELRRLGYEETDENEYLCTRKWEKDFDYRGKVYRGVGRFIFTIWDYSHLWFEREPYRYEGSAVFSVGGLFKCEFGIKLASPEEIELKVKMFLDGELPQQT